MESIRSSCAGTWHDGTACGSCDKCRATGAQAAARIAELLREKAEREARTEAFVSAILEAAACMTTRQPVADGWSSDPDCRGRIA